MQLSEAQEYLMNGVTFLKYGRRGKPKPRHIFLIDKALSWREPGSKSVPEKKDQKKFVRFMPILDFKDIRRGRDSEGPASILTSDDQLGPRLRGNFRSIVEGRGGRGRARAAPGAGVQPRANGGVRSVLGGNTYAAE